MISPNPTTVNLDAISRQYGKAAEKITRRVVICAGTGCMAGGSMKVYKAFVEKVAKDGLPVVTELKAEDDNVHNALHVSKSGCQGFCQMGPLVAIEPDGILYTRVAPSDVDGSSRLRSWARGSSSGCCMSTRARGSGAAGRVKSRSTSSSTGRCSRPAASSIRRTFRNTFTTAVTRRRCGPIGR